jgi:hypothetical protein
MNNITYTIIDAKNDNSSTDSPTNNGSYPWEEVPLKQKDDINVDETKKVFNNFIESDDITKYNELCARELEYELNYPIKYLIAILDFYGIKKGKCNKKNIIDKILEFEIDEDNFSIVETRKRLFDNFIELKNNSFFSKFIISNFT